LGVLEASVLPSTFYRFFATMAYSGGLQYALLRADGTFLARYPQPAGALLPLDARTGFARQIAKDPAGGYYTSTSPVDNVERRFGVRRIGTTPLYLSAGVETATIRAEWAGAMAPHLIF